MARRDVRLDDTPLPFKNFVNNFYKGSSIAALGTNEIFLLNLDAALTLATFSDKTVELTCFKQWEDKVS
ncbi:unnamed protein product [Allacma fusca]|uniref:Uncharacterized protein n=1 Tax=Allacma fusca TaxID=39272 RepID=A0A8J2JPG8_9HEXA|nr:unnamed protein product [Allacma fusca]